VPIGERDLSQTLRDWMTAITRLGPAFWTVAENPVDWDGWNRAKAVLANPGAARPEELREFSERYFGMDPGWTSFLVDSVVHPAVFLGLPLAKGASALGIGSKPSALAVKWAEDFGTSYMPRPFQTYNSMFQRMGFHRAAEADILVNERYTKFYSDLMRRWNTVKLGYMERYGPEAWLEGKERVAAFSQGYLVPGIRPEERQLSEMIRGVYDSVYDDVATVERLGKGVRINDLVRARGEPRNLEGAVETLIDPEVMGYQLSYLTRVARDDAEVLMRDPAEIHAVLTGQRGGMRTASRQLSRMERFRAEPFDPAAASLEDWHQWQRRYFDSELGHKQFNPYRLPRSQALTQDEWANRFIVDIDRLFPAYARRAARSYALEVPLTPQEALKLTKRWDPRYVDTAKLQGLNRQFREALRAGDAAGADAARVEIQNLSRSIPFDQRSLNLQLRVEAASRWMYDPATTAPGTLGSTAKRFEAEAFHQWWELLQGKQDVAKWPVARAMAGFFHSASTLLGDGTVQQLNAIGGKVGAENFGTHLRSWLANASEIRTTAGMERSLTLAAYSNILGFRPLSAFVNLTQIPLVTGPTIGFGNMMHGILEGTPKLARAWRLAAAESRAHPELRGMGASRRIFRQKLAEVAPEIEAAGLLTDMRELEMGAELLGRGDPNAFHEWAMRLFSSSEQFNRLVTFYGARHRLEKTLFRNPQAAGLLAGEFPVRNLGPAERIALLNHEAAKVVYETQFIPTPGRRAPIHSTVLRGPALRQFSSYPIGFGNWFMDAGSRAMVDERAIPLAGTLQRALGGQKSWVPHARWLVAVNGLAQFGSDVMGVDLGEKTVGGIVPLPFADSVPFAPLPVPVVPATVVGLAAAALTGDVKKMNPVELPWVGTIPVPKVLFPAGLAVSQASRVLNQLRVNGVPGDHLLVDEYGRGLEEVDTSGAWLRALGFTTEHSRRDRLKLRQLYVVQAKLREFRRRLGLAIIHGNASEIRRVQAEYQRDPQLGSGPPLTVSRDDIERLRGNMRQERLSRSADRMKREAGILGFDRDPWGLDAELQQGRMIQPAAYSASP